MPRQQCRVYAMRHERSGKRFLFVADVVERRWWQFRRRRAERAVMEVLRRRCLKNSCRRPPIAALLSAMKARYVEAPAPEPPPHFA